MELVVVTECNQDLISKLELFEQRINRKLSFMDQVKRIRKDNKQPVKNSVELSDLIYSLRKGEIINLCYLSGNSDNKLVELKILNLNPTHKKTNINFVEAATNYAFSSLNAETVTIFSNDFSGDDLSGIGYESLGKYKDENTFVKDRQNETTMGVIQK